MSEKDQTGHGIEIDPAKIDEYMDKHQYETGTEAEVIKGDFNER